jgi:hypothetical protein
MAESPNDAHKRRPLSNWLSPNQSGHAIRLASGCIVSIRQSRLLLLFFLLLLLILTPSTAAAQVRVPLALDQPGSIDLGR